VITNYKEVVIFVSFLTSRKFWRGNGPAGKEQNRLGRRDFGNEFYDAIIDEYKLSAAP